MNGMQLGNFLKSNEKVYEVGAMSRQAKQTNINKKTMPAMRAHKLP
ncbi:MAG: hypothetical protein MJZ49_04780 [Bacteroidales bacterium]|nr:hypothetical protein [Bacteroidales bacterium]